MVRTLIKERQSGTRYLAGVDWPIVDQLHRVQVGSRPRWIVTRALCNGVPDRAEIYKTKREALKNFFND